MPAAGYDWALPFYDPIVRLLGGDRVRRTLVDQAEIRVGQRVLDIGCGTGTLVVLIKTLHPGAEVSGLDPDERALFRARRKAYAAKVAVQLDRGFSDELPYPDGSYDRVFSSFMLHHLEPAEKERTLREIRRILKPGGSLHLLDFGGSAAARAGLLGRRFHAHHHLEDNAGGRILALLGQAGFAEVKETGGKLLFAHIAYYRAS